MNFVIYTLILIISINFFNIIRMNFIKQFLISLLILFFYSLMGLIFFDFKIENLSFNLFILIFFFFIYAALQKSISIKMVIDIEKQDFNFEEYYQIFKKTSYDSRIESLIKDQLIIKFDGEYKLAQKALNFRKLFISLQNIYGIKNSG